MHQQYLCSLCSTMPLQYNYYTANANGPEKTDQVLKNLCSYIATA